MRTFSKYLLTVIFFFFTNADSFASSKDPLRARNGIVVSASRIASEVGTEILKKGGNAIDAAVGVGFALAVTYPAAGNIGGGGFMLIHFRDGSSTSIDYREKAPFSAYESMYLDSAGNFLPGLSQDGVTSAGVPGSVAGLVYALEKYGTFPLEDVIQPAIDLAENGFELEYRLAKSLEYENENFNKYPSSKKVFTKDGIPYDEGDRLIQKDLAFTLRQIRDHGTAGFYEGRVADLIVAQIVSDGGSITAEDLRSYSPAERVPLRTNYRGLEVLTMGPPSAGGVSLIQMLNILENFTFKDYEWGSSGHIHKLVEAMKYSFADRSMHIGDPDFYNVPLGLLLSRDYAEKISCKIGDSAVSSEDIAPAKFSLYPESEETTHYSIIDKYGNAVSTTTTINSSFGSKVVVEGAGFLLNNEMDDFSAKPGVPNQFGLVGSGANKIEPGKRMVSSMSPAIVTKNKMPYLVIGSPGGSTISTVVLQVLMNVVDFGMDIQQAIDMPRIHHQWLPDKIDYEKFGLTVDVIESLVEMGHMIGDERTLGRVEGIMSDNFNNIFYGATDPRGFGSAAGY